MVPCWMVVDATTRRTATLEMVRDMFRYEDMDSFVWMIAIACVRYKAHYWSIQRTKVENGQRLSFAVIAGHLLRRRSDLR